MDYKVDLMKHKVSYLTTVVKLQDLPPEDRPEVAIAGRSNAGKSSLLNAMTGQKVADASKTPGKTRGLNFFDVGKKYYFVDLPGYGYAQRSGGEMRVWGPLIEGYFLERSALSGVILVIDGQRKWTSDEAQLLDFWTSRGLPAIVAVNKADRLNQKERSALIKHLRDEGVTHVHLVSARTSEGVYELEDRVFKSWIKEQIKL